MLHYAPPLPWVIACVGAGTAFLAATIACAQDDIKKALAYSTISQLGYMFLAIGAGDYVAGLFHMLTHAFFKALLFLAAGAVIHAMADNQDMKKMGGLRKYLPLTAITFAIGWLAISGIPPFAGFWSKDAILQGPSSTTRRCGPSECYGRPDGLLHEPPVRPGLQRPGPLGRGSPSPGASTGDSPGKFGHGSGDRRPRPGHGSRSRRYRGTRGGRRAGPACPDPSRPPSTLTRPGSCLLPLSSWPSRRCLAAASISRSGTSTSCPVS